VSVSSTPEITGKYFPLSESDPNSDAEQLRICMDEWGYLFFRSLIPTEDVLGVRQGIMKLFGQIGWLDPSANIMEGIVTPSIMPNGKENPETSDPYRQLLQLVELHTFPRHPALVSIAQKLLEGDVTVHPRRIVRMTFPGSAKLATPPHQDFFFIRGSTETYTCWTPLGECPQELGGLAIWPRTHRSGLVEHLETHMGTGKTLAVPVDESQAEWHTANFRVGDALFFHSCTIHKALPNVTANRIRISTENRYVKATASLDQQNPYTDMLLMTVISATGDTSVLTKTLTVSEVGDEVFATRNTS
jgi:ectoine hydroxylase-related dioxygenase (phytanoyl-CoA dioxygenase family)